MSYIRLGTEVIYKMRGAMMRGAGSFGSGQKNCGSAIYRAVMD